MIKNLNGIIIPLIMYIIAQTAAGIWWAAQLDNRVTRLEADFIKMDQTLEGLTEAINKLNLQLERMSTEHDFILGERNRVNNIAK